MRFLQFMPHLVYTHRGKRDPSFTVSVREIKLLYYNNNSSMCQFRNAKCARVLHTLYYPTDRRDFSKRTPLVFHRAAQRAN